MSARLNLSLRCLVERDKLNSLPLSPSNAPTIGDTKSKAYNKVLVIVIRAESPNNNEYKGLDFKRVLYLKRR
ncbi:hypothetical protein GQ44DRAFT_607808 [Phaeosphaeriaceae sp. PMI808]|nr:hypothetical protein GQ44DRAFT_607808 [Phaeosphaeriaceae sp. PMI808]